MELCLESFWRDHNTEIVKKKIAASHFLPETSPSMAIVFQIVEGERAVEKVEAQGLRSHCQKD